MPFIKFLSAIPLIFVFWPTLRFGGLSYFDLFAPLAIIGIFVFAKNDKDISLSMIQGVLVAVVLLALSGLISLLNAGNIQVHLVRIVTLLLALFTMIFYSYSLISHKIFSFAAILKILCISATVGSFVCILQGQLGLFHGLTFRDPSAVHEMSRFTGFAQHPIEAGYVAVYGILLGILLLCKKEKRLFALVCIVINLYSMRYSGSLTSLAALIGGLGILALYLRSYKLILGLGCVAILFSGFVVLGANSSPLAIRIVQIINKGANYSTLQDREEQWKETIERIDFVTFAIGNGYDRSTLPHDLDIHNGFIAALYHFGIIGLLSQLMFFIFFGRSYFNGSDKYDKAMFLVLMFVFFCAYMTGPPFSRRTLWMPVILFAVYLSSFKKDEPNSKLKNYEFLR